MTTKHTPGPWECTKRNNPISIPLFDISNSEGVFYTLSFFPGRYHPDGWEGFRGEAEANAAFIVHACNAHDRLTKINEDLVAALETVAALSVDGMVTTGKPLIAAIAQARAALAKWVQS